VTPRSLAGYKGLAYRAAGFAEGDKFPFAEVAVFPEGDKFSSKGTSFPVCDGRKPVAMSMARQRADSRPLEGNRIFASFQTTNTAVQREA
jgi:hypothetical protein